MMRGRDPSWIVLVGGHESNDGADLEFVKAALPNVLSSPPGRPLNNVVSRALDATDGVVAVLPMTFGRNPTMVADAAKTMQWLSTGREGGRLTLCDPFGSADHLVAWLRTAASRTSARRPNAGIIVAAPRSNPFDDAELYRLAHLVRTHGAGNDVEVCCYESDGDVVQSIQRFRALGRGETEIVPAGFARTSPVDLSTPAATGAEFYGPLMSEQAIVRIITERVAEAEHNLGHGQNGIEDGLLADHDHGFAHSHAFEEGQAPHTHSHAGVPHTHGGHGEGHNHETHSDQSDVRPDEFTHSH